MNLYYNYEKEHNPQKIFNIFSLYMYEINNQIKSKFKGNNKETKFVVLVYSENGFEDWDKLRKNGIIVLNINDILGFDINRPEYTFSDKHPNKKAWEIIVPAVVKELNL